MPSLCIFNFLGYFHSCDSFLSLLSQTSCLKDAVSLIRPQGILPHCSFLKASSAVSLDFLYAPLLGMNWQLSVPCLKLLVTSEHLGSRGEGILIFALSATAGPAHSKRQANICYCCVNRWITSAGSLTYVHICSGLCKSGRWLPSSICTAEGRELLSGPGVTVGHLGRES